MHQLIECPNCKKTVPTSGVSTEDKSIKQALEASLDCNGNPIFDFSRLNYQKSKNSCDCYWCGTTIELVQEPEQVITEPEIDRETRRTNSRPAAYKKDKLYIPYLVAILIAAIAPIPYFAFIVIAIGALVIYLKRKGVEFNSDFDFADVKPNLLPCIAYLAAILVVAILPISGLAFLVIIAGAVLLYSKSLPVAQQKSKKKSKSNSWVFKNLNVSATLASIAALIAAEIVLYTYNYYQYMYWWSFGYAIDYSFNVLYQTLEDSLSIWYILLAIILAAFFIAKSLLKKKTE